MALGTIREVFCFRTEVANATLEWKSLRVFIMLSRAFDPLNPEKVRILIGGAYELAIILTVLFDFPVLFVGRFLSLTEKHAA